MGPVERCASLECCYAALMRLSKTLTRPRFVSLRAPRVGSFAHLMAEITY